MDNIEVSVDKDKFEAFEEWLILQTEDVDWNEKIDKEMLIEINGHKFVPLSELDRLARERGFASSESMVIQPPVYENHRNATVTWRIVWNDGTSIACSADANWRTINPGFRNFPICIAENRARARTIRLSLGITMCSYEEIGPEDEDLSEPSSDQQRSAIDMLIKRYKLDHAQLVEILGDKIGV